MVEGEFVDILVGFNWGLSERRLDGLILWHEKEWNEKNTNPDNFV